MKALTIKNVQISDGNDSNDNKLLSLIALSVEIIVNNDTFYIAYQTTENCDYDFVNSNIELYRDNQWAEGLIEALEFDDHEDSFDFFEELKIKNGWQKLFDEYVKENYTQEDNDNFYDANSENNKITIKV